MRPLTSLMILCAASEEFGAGALAEAPPTEAPPPTPPQAINEPMAPAADLLPAAEPTANDKIPDVPTVDANGPSLADEEIDAAIAQQEAAILSEIIADENQARLEQHVAMERANAADPSTEVDMRRAPDEDTLPPELPVRGPSAQRRALDEAIAARTAPLSAQAQVVEHAVAARDAPVEA